MAVDASGKGTMGGVGTGVTGATSVDGKMLERCTGDSTRSTAATVDRAPLKRRDACMPMSTPKNMTIRPAMRSKAKPAQVKPLAARAARTASGTGLHAVRVGGVAGGIWLPAGATPGLTSGLASRCRGRPPSAGTSTVVDALSAGTNATGSAVIVNVAVTSLPLSARNGVRPATRASVSAISAAA